jgi:hypothetical protein
MPIEIRSYRSVFEVERRIYRVDRVRLNPGGVPVRGAVYFLALLLASLLVAALPLVGALARLLPWYVCYLALPAGAAALLSAVRIDGRSFHVAAWALLAYAAQPGRMLGDGRGLQPIARWRPGEVVVLPDGSEGGLRRMLCTGPARVRVAVAHERVEWRHGHLGRLVRREGVTVRELRGRRPPRRAQVIALRAGARLRVR